MTPADIAKVIADLADIWRGSDEFSAIRSVAGGFLSALRDQSNDCLPDQKFLFDAEAFWRDCRIDKSAEPATVEQKNRSVDIETDDGKTIILSVWNQDRIATRGFGAFLEDYDPKEIGITEQARALLLTGRYISGLAAMEFFGHPVLGWCSRVAEISSISVHGDDARALISQFVSIG